MKDKLKINGVVTIKRDGHEPIVINNLVVDSGLTYIINRVLGDDTDTIGYISVGTGITAAAPSDTGMSGGTIHNENYRTLQLVSPNNLLVESLIGNDYTSDVNEIGLFTTGGTLIARTVLPLAQRFTKLLNEDISVVWNITIG
jgi:hypothetical protein